MNRKSSKKMTAAAVLILKIILAITVFWLLYTWYKTGSLFFQPILTSCQESVDETLKFDDDSNYTVQKNNNTIVYSDMYKYVTDEFERRSYDVYYFQDASLEKVKHVLEKTRYNKYKKIIVFFETDYENELDIPDNAIV